MKYVGPLVTWNGLIPPYAPDPKPALPVWIQNLK